MSSVVIISSGEILIFIIIMMMSIKSVLCLFGNLFYIELHYEAHYCELKELNQRVRTYN